MYPVVEVTERHQLEQLGMDEVTVEFTLRYLQANRKSILGLTL